MKKLLLSILRIAPLLAVLASQAANAAPMTNDDVIKMVKGGLGDATVLQAIEAAEPGFDTSPDGLVKLKQGGVSEAVIQRILARKGSAPSPMAVAPASVPSATAPPPSVASCRDCGTVTGIREIEQPRKTGAGTAAGAVIGGVLGYAIGGPNNRGVGTAVGAVGGAVAGNVIENKAGAGKTFEIGVRFDDGSNRVYTQDTHPSWSAGSRVKLVNGALAPL